jgi:hypothetical protein
MSQLGAGPPERRGDKPAANVYTALMFVATAALLMGIVVVWYRSYALFGSANPFASVQGG